MSYNDAYDVPEPGGDWFTPAAGLVEEGDLMAAQAFAQIGYGLQLRQLNANLAEVIDRLADLQEQAGSS